MILIAAVDDQWGIGYDGKLLFQCKRDQEHFRKCTVHHTVIMGRKTLESLPGGRPLCERKNVILSQREGYTVPGAIVVSSLKECLNICSGEENCYIIGGGDIYHMFLPYSSEAIITKVGCRMKADVYFPNLDCFQDWELKERISQWEENGILYRIYRYKKLE